MSNFGNRITLIAGCTVVFGLLVWLGLTAARADLSPATSPTSQNSGNSATPPARPQSINAAAVPSDHSQPMPRDYAVLLNRSMFVRGHAAESGHLGQNFAPPSTTAPMIDRSETSLIFNGVTKTADTIDALVEDSGSGRVLTVRVGDAIAKGKVRSITFDTLSYERDGKVIQVQIGQNLTGSTVDVSSIPTTSTPAGSGASPQDILERLRLKRLQELGGGK